MEKRFLYALALALLIGALLLVGCAKPPAEVHVKTEVLVCPDPPPQRWCPPKLTRPRIVADVLNALDQCRAEANAWRESFQACVEEE